MDWRNVVTKQFILFLLVGGINTGFGYLMYAMFIYLGFNYPMALLLATLICPFFNFLTTGRIVFKNRDNRLVVRFIALYAVLYFVNVGVLKCFTFVTTNLYLGGFYTTCVMAIVAFICQKRLVFRALPQTKATECP